MRTKLKFLLISLTLTIAYSNCSKKGFQVDQLNVALGSSTSLSAGAGVTSPVTLTGANVVPVNAGNCGYVNAPCVSVTICTPGTTTCQTIPNILLDTGSFGLRVFSSLVSVSLTNVTDSSSRTLAECTTYADGASQWGPVKKADVILGSERAPNVSVQIIDSTMAGVPTSCTNLDTTPASAGFNGILGVGLFADDCGNTCATSSTNNLYYACASGTCTGTTVAIAAQVTNPVALMPLDNNGVILTMPAVTSSGAISVAGSLILGIGTQSNNMPGSVSVYDADGHGNFRTVFNGTTYTAAFVDSGSNGLFFPRTTSLPDCASTSNAPGFFCPTSLLSFSAITMGATNSTASTISFQIMNADSAFASSNPNWVFNDIGANMAGTFDLGFPFFLGRTVYVGLENRTSSLGTGPYWAY